MRNSRLFNTAAYLTLTAIVTMLLIQVVLLFIIAGKTQSQMGTQPMLPTFPYYFENYERAWKLGIDDYSTLSI
jgi:ABC-type glycerol-3-phosphate transport system permease component